jgi:anti-sigma factor RsiW
MKHEWTDRFSEYLDGHLAEDEAVRVERHVEECAECSATLEQLRAVVQRARRLSDREPSRELWRGIREGIAPDTKAPDVIDLVSRREIDGRPAGRRVVRLTIPQLVAAGLALALASGTGAWLLLPEVPLASGSATPEIGQAVPALRTAAGEPSSADVATGDATQTDELGELEELLARHRSELAPHTVRILEKNLAAIDRAIEDSRRALAVDPGNTFLEGHLERARQRKLEYLRDASVAFQWSS